MLYLTTKAKKKIELLEAEIDTLGGEIDTLVAETQKAKNEETGLEDAIAADKEAGHEALEAFLTEQKRLA